MSVFAGADTETMSAEDTFNPDSPRSEMPITTRELELMKDEASEAFRDRDSIRKVAALLRRFEVTCDNFRGQIRGLKFELAEERHANAKLGVATTLSPRDAVKYLSPSELAAIVEPAAASAIKRAEELTATAEKERMDLNRQVSAIKEAIEDLRSSVDADTMARFDAVVAAHGTQPVENPATSGSWISELPTSQNPASGSSDGEDGLDDLFA